MWGTMGAGGRKRSTSSATCFVYFIWASRSAVSGASLHSHAHHTADVRDR
jgi:hypothetical protein